ncbi:MAG: hypothetical protein U0736_18505 [Gemmataceae bacterium]
MPDNPFEVLRLSPDATEHDAVEQAARLAARTADEAARAAVRQAVARLTASADDRLLLAVLTHARPDYAVPELERALAAHRRPPADQTDLPIPPIDLDEFRDLLLHQLQRELSDPPAPFEPVPADEPAEEIDRQTAEALWQRLVSDPGA